MIKIENINKEIYIKICLLYDDNDMQLLILEILAPKSPQDGMETLLDAF